MLDLQRFLVLSLLVLLPPQLARGCSDRAAGQLVASANLDNAPSR